MFIEIPADRTAVFSNDGRVFYDLGDLITQFEATVEQHETLAPLLGREDEAKGERGLITALKASLEALNFEAAMIDRNDETE